MGKYLFKSEHHDPSSPRFSFVVLCPVKVNILFILFSDQSMLDVIAG